MDIVDIALASCAKSLGRGEKLVVIPRWHPGASQEFKEKLNAEIAKFADAFPNAVSILLDQAINTDHLAALADGTFAATGSALRAAAYASKIPICVWTESLGLKLLAESGMEHHPLAVSSAGLEIDAGDEHIVRLIRRLGDDVRKYQKELLHPVPFDASLAADAIVTLTNS
jgi:hypothetical protein